MGTAHMDFLGRHEQGWVTCLQAVSHLFLMCDFAPCKHIPEWGNGNATSSASQFSVLSVTSKCTLPNSNWLSGRKKDHTSV